jgi:hypothetical protein
MLIRKTMKRQKRRSETWPRRYYTEETHVEVVRVETWWLLFLPVYSKTFIETSVL